MIDLEALVTPPTDAWKLDEPGRFRLKHTSIVIDLDITKYSCFRLRWINHGCQLVEPYGGECTSLEDAKKKALALFKVLELTGCTP